MNLGESWLGMNAMGLLYTCESNEKHMFLVAYG